MSRNLRHRLAASVFLVCLTLTVSVVHASTLPNDVHGELLLPKSNAPVASIIILHGRRGFVPAWKELGKILKEKGYAVLLLDYFAETGEPENVRAIRRNWSTWVETVRKATNYLAEHPRVRADSIGIVGFSLGGFLGVHAAGTLPRIRTVVEFYGGATPQLDTYVHKLPPVLILHGEDDTMVSVETGLRLHEAMKNAGRTVEMKLYPSAGHCFDCNAYGLRYDEDATQDAHLRMFEFFRTHLSK